MSRPIPNEPGLDDTDDPKYWDVIARTAEREKGEAEPSNEGADRHCPVCGKPVYYGLYCSNVCSDQAYAKWKKERNAQS